MHVIKTVSELKQCLTSFKNISFVPTMGNLHAGHMALFEEAYKKREGVVFSIFINRIQFNDSNDFINYPRTLANDLSLIKKNFHRLSYFTLKRMNYILIIRQRSSL